MRGSVRVLVAILVLVVAAGCGDDTPGANVVPTATTTPTGVITPTTTTPTTPSGRTGRTVDVVDNAYVPPELTVTVGTEVIWSYVGPDAPHTVTASDGSFDSSPECDTTNLDKCMKAKGETFRFTFTKAGTFGYSCNVHGELMSGTIVVE